jgi:hypothetical protein
VAGLHLAALVGVGVMVVSTLAAARYVPARVPLDDDDEDDEALAMRHL